MKYQHLIKNLAKHYRCIAPDHLGSAHDFGGPIGLPAAVIAAIERFLK